MSRIAILDDALIDQIKAGEVIERPASVVKELVDNALDSGATTIAVSLADGGKARIQVADDGGGMSREDALMAVRRHATSKLRRFDDLSALDTLGFRGEALPSIAAVSRFSIKTRPRDEVEGTEVRIDGGAAPAVQPVGCAPGTTVDVRDLFFNVPARKKFLRARQTELLRAGDVVRRAALANAHVRFKLDHDGRTLQEHLPASSVYVRAKDIFRDQPLRPIQGESDEMRLHGALGEASRAKRGTGNLYLFVNGRPVEDRTLARAIAFAFGDALTGGSYPSGAVFLEIDPSRVDINAHPQKKEVRFEEPHRVRDAITRILIENLGTRRWTDTDGESVRGTEAQGRVGDPSRDLGSYRQDSFWSARLNGRRDARGASGPMMPAAPAAGQAPFSEKAFSENALSNEAPFNEADSEEAPSNEADSEEAFVRALRDGPSPTWAKQDLRAEPTRPPSPSADVDRPEASDEPSLEEGRCLGALSNGVVVGELDGSVHHVRPRALWETYAKSLLASADVLSRRLLFPTQMAWSKPVDLELLASLGFSLAPFGEQHLKLQSVPRLDPELGVEPDALAASALNAGGDREQRARAVARTYAERAQRASPEIVWACYRQLATELRSRVATVLTLSELTKP